MSPIPHAGSWPYHVANRRPSHLLPNLFSVSLITLRARRTLLWFLSLSPREYCPTPPTREPLEPPRRINRHRPTDRFEYPSIIRAVSVRVALRQLKSLFRCDLPYSSGLCLAEHRVSNNPSRPSPISFFQSRGANRHTSRDPPHCQPRHQSQRHLLRQRCQRAAHQDNGVPLPRVPSHLVHPFRKEPWDSHFWLSSFATRSVAARAHTSQIHFVRIEHHPDSSRREPHRPCQPKKIIPHRNGTPLPQFRKEPPLERRPCNQRPVQIKKCRNPSGHFARFHAIFLATLFPPRATTPSAKYFHPSSRTGNPRTRQNPAVAHAKICAPMRISICASAVKSPISATGPRVSASSNPK